MGRINSAVLIESAMQWETKAPTRLPKLRRVLLFDGSKLIISSSTSCKFKLRHSKRVIFVSLSGADHCLETPSIEISVMSDAELNESAKTFFLRHPFAYLNLSTLSVANFVESVTCFSSPYIALFLTVAP